MNDDYLWDGSGSLDPDVAHFERWAGRFGHGARPAATTLVPLRTESGPRRKSVFGSSAAWGVAAALFLVWLGLWGPKVPRPAEPTPEPSMSPAVLEVDRDSASPVVAPPALPAPRSPSLPAPDPEPPAVEPSPTPSTGAPTRRARPRARPPSAKADDAEVPDEVYERTFHGLLSKAGPRIDQCFREHAPNNPKGGLVELHLVVARDGTATGSRFVRTNFIDPAEGRATGECLAGVLRSSSVPPTKQLKLPLESPMVLFHPGPE